MDPQKVTDLQGLVQECKSNPALLHHPSLSFFRDYLRSLGARVPPPTMSSPMKTEDDTEDFNNKKPNEKDKHADIKDEIVESDVELDGEVVEPDNDPPEKMGDPSVEISEESRDAAQICKAKALEATFQGKFNEAIEHLTEAILLNPSSAILYATRASLFVKLNKPNAAIRDADAALQINPDSAKGYKYRGIAKTMLGQWEEAANDLHTASKLDHDEEINSMLKRVEPNVHKIEEHRRKYERLRKERDAKKADRERQPKKDADVKDPESLAVLQDGTVISIHSASELQKKVRAASLLSRLTILYFTATWCGPCRFIAPIYKTLAEKHPKAVFLKLDIDELGDVAHRWNVSSVPTFFFLKDGKEIDKVVGADKSGLERKIALHAGK